MTLPASGAISLFNIADQFHPGNGHSGVSLRSFLSGGSYVPAGTKNGAGGTIPSSGQLSIQQFYGAPEGGPVDLVDRSWSESASWGINKTGSSGTMSALCWLNIFGDGTLVCERGQSPIGEINVHVFDDQWYSPSGGNPGANYWVRATVVSGTLASGSSPTGVYISLNNSAPSWNCAADAQFTSGTVTSALIITLDVASNSAGTQVVTSATYTMHCTANGGA